MVESLLLQRLVKVNSGSLRHHNHPPDSDIVCPGLSLQHEIGVHQLFLGRSDLRDGPGRVGGRRCVRGGSLKLML